MRRRHLVPFHNIKDTLVDYTWRSTGIELMKCPYCRKNGVTRKVADGTYMVVHSEIMSEEASNRTLVEYCMVDEEDVLMYKKRKERTREIARLSYERQKAKRLEKMARYLEGGQSIVEMALLVPLLCLLLFGTLDIGRLIQAQTRVSNAAHLAMRDVQNVENVSGTSIRTVDVENQVASDFPGVVVSITPIGKVVSNESITVNAAYQFHMVTPFVRNMIGVSSIHQTVTETTLP